jgi:KDO2-lipid IV(A) lauroyltransferase
MHAIAGLGGTISYRANGVSVHVTRRNLALCFPQMSDAEREVLVKQSLIETMKTGCELGLAWYSSIQKSLNSIRKVIGSDLIEQAMKNGRGVIVLAPHLGNWEIGGHYLSHCGATTYLYKPPTLKGLEEFMIRVRSRAGASLAPTNRKGVAQLVKALERAEIVGILPDQEPKDEGGVFAPFFGHQALTMTLVPKIAARTGALVVTMVARRLEGSKGFELVFEAVDDAVSDEDLVVATTAMNRSVEKCVLGAVAQYQWEYRRFKRQPDNTRNALYN